MTAVSNGIEINSVCVRMVVDLMFSIMTAFLAAPFKPQLPELLMFYDSS